MLYEKIRLKVLMQFLHNKQMHYKFRIQSLDITVLSFGNQTIEQERLLAKLLYILRH